MNGDDVRGLLGHSESTWLDWKRDFPSGVQGGNKDPNWNPARGEIIKDLLGVANGSDTRPVGYLVYGVKDLGYGRQVFGVTKQGWDDAVFQQWVQNVVEPVPKFSYGEFEIEAGKIVGAFEIHRVPQYPHVVIQDLGGVLHEGQVWYRLGSKNTIAHSTELRTMFLGDKPFTFSTSFDEKLKQIEQSIVDKGWEPVRPLVIDKEARIVAGYEVVFYPSTRREIWVGGPGQETILMRRKRG